MKKYGLLLLLLCVASVSAQVSLSGTISSEIDGAPINNVEVYLTNLSLSTTTNEQGYFIFQDIPEGSHTLVAFAFEYEIEERALAINKNTLLDISLPLLGETLSEVFITKRKERIFALKQLKDVEGTAIYAGKKSEVVIMDNLTANIATGNARQIYAQVVGLNIYENNDYRPPG